MKTPLLALLLWVAAPVAAQPTDLLDGRPVAEWIGLLRVEDGELESPNPDVDLADVLDKLCGLEHSAKTIPALLTAFAAKTTATRRVAAHCLRRAARAAWRAREDPPGRRALALLASKRAIRLATTSLADADPDVRGAGCFLLTAAGPRAEGSVPALKAALNDRKWRGRFQAAEPLGAIGGKAALAVLTAALADADELVVESVAKAIGQLGSLATSAVPALIKTLKREPKPVEPGPGGVLVVDGGYQEAAAYALARVGPLARAAAPALASALSVKRVTLRQAAAWALANVRAEAALAALIVAASDSDALVRQRVALALGRLGAKAREAIPALEAALNRESDPRANRAQVEALRLLRVAKTPSKN